MKWKNAKKDDIPKLQKLYIQQRWKDPKYDINETKQNKEAKQERWQEPKYHTDEVKWNKRNSARKMT